MYILKHWIDIENLNCDSLSGNPNAIDLLQANIDKNITFNYSNSMFHQINEMYLYHVK